MTLILLVVWSKGCLRRRERGCPRSFCDERRGHPRDSIYATTDDILKEHLDLAPWRPPVGMTPGLSDAELVTLRKGSRETVKRSDLTGWAEYGYCASHSRFYWGLRLHLVCTLQGLPIAFLLTGTKADERETLLDLLAAECEK